MFSNREKLTINNKHSDVHYLEYARQCVDVVEHIAMVYQDRGTVFPDELKQIYKEHGLRL